MSWPIEKIRESSLRYAAGEGREISVSVKPKLVLNKKYLRKMIPLLAERVKERLRAENVSFPLTGHESLARNLKSGAAGRPRSGTPSRKETYQIFTDFLAGKLILRAGAIASSKGRVGLREGFYWSAEWRSIRYRRIKESGGRCGACGRGAKDGVIIHVDHIKPRSTYPALELDYDNTQVLCEDCNVGKSNRDETDWR